MSEPSVTEIQKALREHAEHGHDVLSDRHSSIIRGKPYGMRLGTSLTFSRIGDSYAHRLDSELMQSERPLITNVNSYLGYDRERQSQRMLRVYPQFPTINDFKDQSHHSFMSGSPDDLSHPGHETHYRDRHEYDEHVHSGMSGKTTDKDVHSVLEAHKTDKFPAFGVTVNFRGNKDDDFVASNSGLLMPEDAGKFKMSEALARLTHPFKPGANLVKVTYGHTMNPREANAPWRYYEYNPEHETLKEITDYKGYDERP